MEGENQVEMRPKSPGTDSEGFDEETKAHPLRLALEDARKVAEELQSTGKKKVGRKKISAAEGDSVGGAEVGFDTEQIDLAVSRGRGRRKIPTSGKGWKQSNLVAELRILLNDSTPRVWRRVRVPLGVSLYRMHCIIQIAMGWMEQEDFYFSTQDNRLYTLPAIARKVPEKTHDCRKVCVGQILSGVGESVTYHYDFEDRWVHEIRVEKMYKATNRQELSEVLVLNGRRACPPEKSGGALEYSNTVLPILKNRSHRLYSTYMAWAGIGFNPNHLDLKQVNESLLTVLSSRRLADQL